MLTSVHGDVVGCSGDHYDFVNSQKSSVGRRYGGSDGDALTFVI